MADTMTVLEISERANVSKNAVFGAIKRKTLAAQKDDRDEYIIPKADALRYIKRARALKKVQAMR